MTEQTQNLLVATIVPTVTALGALIMGWRNSGKADVQAVKQDASDIKLEAVAKTAESIHTLSNSIHGTALRASMLSSRRLADVTHSAADIAEAALADKLFNEHEAKQAKVDAAVGEPAALK